jgi:hypothetical protein
VRFVRIGIHRWQTGEIEMASDLETAVDTLRDELRELSRCTGRVGDMIDSLMLPEDDDDDVETKLKASVPDIVNIIRGATALKEQAADMPYYAREVEIALEDLGLLGVGEKRRQHEEDEEDENGEPDAPASEPPKA